jgi:hypothetical protein
MRCISARQLKGTASVFVKHSDVWIFPPTVGFLAWIHPCYLANLRQLKALTDECDATIMGEEKFAILANQLFSQRDSLLIGEHRRGLISPTKSRAVLSSWLNIKELSALLGIAVSEGYQNVRYF